MTKKTATPIQPLPKQKPQHIFFIRENNGTVLSWPIEAAEAARLTTLLLDPEECPSYVAFYSRSAPVRVDIDTDVRLCGVELQMVDA